MDIHKDFLSRFVRFTQEPLGEGQRSIRWAVVGSHAMVAHAEQAGIQPYRKPHDLDLIVFLPRERDREFKAWLTKEWPRHKDKWIRDRQGRQLELIHVWPDSQGDYDRQIDLFLRDTTQINRAASGVVLGEPCRIVSVEDLLDGAEDSVRYTKDPQHHMHKHHPKHIADVEWIRSKLLKTTTP